MSDIRLSQDYIVVSPRESTVYPITESDWSHIKIMLNNMIQSKKIYSVLSSFFFGIFGSSIFSIISLLTLGDLPPWILPTNIAICVSTLILGIVLLMIDDQQNKLIIYSSKLILEEMKNIEERYGVRG
jgi:hypothetical protein